MWETSTRAKSAQMEGAIPSDIKNEQKINFTTRFMLNYIADRSAVPVEYCVRCLLATRFSDTATKHCAFSPNFSATVCFIPAMSLCTLHLRDPWFLTMSKTFPCEAQ